MVIFSLPDITPNGAASTLNEINNSPLGSAVLEVRGLILVASGSSIRLGGPEVSASRGANLPNNVPVIIPAAFLGMETIPVHQTYVFGASGTDKVSISYWL